MDINVLFVDNEEEKQMREDRLEIDEFLYRVNSYFFTQNINFKLIPFNRDRPVENYREVINDSTVVFDNFLLLILLEYYLKKLFKIKPLSFASRSSTGVIRSLEWISCAPLEYLSKESIRVGERLKFNFRFLKLSILYSISR